YMSTTKLRICATNGGIILPLPKGEGRGEGKGDIRKPAIKPFLMSISTSVLLMALSSSAQTASKFPCPENEVAHYTAYKTSARISVDGRLDEAAWRQAPMSPPFVDILTGKPTLHDTRATL